MKHKASLLSGRGGAALYLLSSNWEDGCLDQECEQYDRPAIAVRHMYLVQVTLQGNRKVCTASVTSYASYIDVDVSQMTLAHNASAHAQAGMLLVCSSDIGSAHSSNCGILL